MITVAAYILLSLSLPDHTAWLYVLTVLLDLVIIEKVSNMGKGAE